MGFAMDHELGLGRVEAGRDRAHGRPSSPCMGNGEGVEMKRDCCPSTGDLSLSLSALPVTTTHPITPS